MIRLSEMSHTSTMTMARNGQMMSSNLRLSGRSLKMAATWAASAGSGLFDLCTARLGDRLLYVWLYRVEADWSSPGGVINGSKRQGFKQGLGNSNPDCLESWVSEH